MSEFTNNSEKRSQALTDYMLGLIEGEDGRELIDKFNLITENYIPSDVLLVFDNLFKANIDIEKIKTASNKLFNILYKTFNNYPSFKLNKTGYLYYLKKDNNATGKVLKSISPNIKKLNATQDHQTIKPLINQFQELLKIDTHYTSKENILFPHLERKWENSDCLKLMWSYHDDIRANIKRCLQILSEKEFDLKAFNKYSAKVFFNIKTIIFREEKVLFPVIKESFEQEEIDLMLFENKDIGFAFLNNDDIEYKKPEIKQKEIKGIIKLETGNLSLKQIELIFNHLPVDITFVDKDDKVQYFSTPKHRIFPRTKSIIGRSIQNCHPPGSIDVVNKIVEAFRNNKKDKASFWIPMNDKLILIQYYAVRDENNEFTGTLEVSQEISDIQKIKGEKRLLDWTN
ncbi:MAG: PAS domain-containing protein [Bacteroidales bacterium]|nr:PAS domain-containing protein [Bacteroidales bacterium]